MPSTSFLDGELPTVGGSEDEWGDILNAFANLLDSVFQSIIEANNYALGVGVDTIAVTLAYPPSAYASGLRVRFKAAGDNTTGPTMNVNGLGAVAIKYSDGSSIPAGGLVSGVIYALDHNGTDFILATSAGPANAAETLAGTSAIKFLTAAGLAGNKSLGTNGYFLLPGGFGLQWGESTTAINSESTVSASFPVAYGNKCVFATAIPRNPGASSGNDGALQWVSDSTTGASFRAQDVGGSLTGFKWFALGY